MPASASNKAPMLGKQAKADLPAALFGEEFHEALVHETARADLAARRRGTASALGRGEVSMTTAKAWRQKGTGRARVGALSAPARARPVPFCRHALAVVIATSPRPSDEAVPRRRALRFTLTV